MSVLDDFPKKDSSFPFDISFKDQKDIVHCVSYILKGSQQLKALLNPDYA